MAKNNSGVNWLFIAFASALLIGFVVSVINSINWSKKIDVPISAEITNAVTEPEPPASPKGLRVEEPTVVSNNKVKFTMRPRLSTTSQEVQAQDKK